MSERLYPIATKEFFLREPIRISAEAAKLYQKGWSLRDIALEFGCSKNKVRADLKKVGIVLRESIAQPTYLRKIESGKQSSAPYFGFCYFNGRIIPDPREFSTLKLIHRFWKSRKTIHQITLELNKLKLPSRKGKEWSWAAVQNILKRFDEKTVVLHKGGRFEFLSKSKSCGNNRKSRR